MPLIRKVVSKLSGMPRRLASPGSASNILASSLPSAFSAALSAPFWFGIPLIVRVSVWFWRNPLSAIPVLMLSNWRNRSFSSTSPGPVPPSKIVALMVTFRMLAILRVFEKLYG